MALVVCMVLRMRLKNHGTKGDGTVDPCDIGSDTGNAGGDNGQVNQIDP